MERFIAVFIIDVLLAVLGISVAYVVALKSLEYFRTSTAILIGIVIARIMLLTTQFLQDILNLNF